MSTDLPTATLGRTGLDITRLGLGAMEIRGALPPDTYAEAKRRLDQAGQSPAPAV